jgi:3-hydroxyisobutyrate dehydrogenase-like beta-hydroxyacid dehydrogenase
MGSAIARRLRERECDVVAWDARSESLAEGVKAGVKAAGSPSEVADYADTIISIITDDDGVRKIFTGPRGFLETPRAGKLFIEMSTLRPATGRELAPLVKKHGARFVVSPVLGTIPSAESGNLTALVGGDAEDVESATGILGLLTKRIVPMGPSGAGYAMKLCANLGLAAYVQAVAEALALGLQQGLTLPQMLDVMNESATATNWLRGKTPLLLGQESPITLDVRTLRKDVASVVATGAESGVPMPLAEGVLEAFSAAVDAGAGDRGMGEVVRGLRESIATGRTRV